MFTNYLKITWRNLKKNKAFSVINILGLSSGIAAFLLIVNYLMFEYSYDQFHEKKDRIYRVPMIIREKDGKEQKFAFTFPAVAPAMKKDFPEIEEAARIRLRWGIVKQGETKIVESGRICFADASLFNIFSLPFVQGQVFRELNDAVITKETAIKYFGNQNPIGKSLHYNDEDFVVKGVISDFPSNSHMKFNILLNYEKYIQETEGRANTSWGWSDFYTYVLLRPGTDLKSLESKLPSFTERYMGSDMKTNGYEARYLFQPVKDIHLRSDYDYELEGNGNLTYLKYLGIAALFILFIAWINYVNLSTAHSLERSKEVGVRKVIGAGRLQLVRQFLAESFIINAFAIIAGILFFRMLLPSFATLVGKKDSDLFVTDWRFWVICTMFFVVGTIVAAFYPAFILSSFQPVYSLKNIPDKSWKGGKQILRKSLVVIQFTAAMVLITSAIGFHNQLRFMQNRDLGIDISQTLILQQTARVDSSIYPSYQAFMNEMSAHPGIRSVTGSSSVPGGEVGGSAGFRLRNSNLDKRCRMLGIDNRFIPAYGLTVIEGRNFTNDRPPGDTLFPVNILVNETAAKIFGFNKPADIVGQQLTGAGFNCMVIGLVKDFHQESLKYSFDPTIFYPGEYADLENFSLKINTSDLPSLMSFIQEKWNAYFPESPFLYSFLDERFNAQYKNDRLFSTVLWLFTATAIIIACLGLFGLSLYTISKRSKEISIRKVLGATILQLTRMITTDYIRLVAIAGLLGIPVAWLMVQSWLNKYAYRVDMGLWFFVLPVILIMAVALVTVLVHSVRASLANPVKNLRTE